jgi:hypothetical protein
VIVFPMHQATPRVEPCPHGRAVDVRARDEIMSAISSLVL